MKILKLLTVAAMVVGLTACGGKKDEEDKVAVMSPETTEVSGDLSDCYTVVDREYRTVNDWGDIITVEIERTGSDLPYELNGRELTTYANNPYEANVQVGFGIEFLDSLGNVIDITNATSYPNEKEDVLALAKLKPGSKGSIRFKVGSTAMDAVKFRITSAFAENEERERPQASESSSSDDSDDDTSAVASDDDDDDDDSSSASSSSSADVDEALAAYEKYVDKLVKFVKEADTDSPTFMVEYTKMLQSCNEAMDKLNKAKGDLTAAQLARFAKIQAKLASAGR